MDASTEVVGTTSHRVLRHALPATFAAAFLLLILGHAGSAHAARSHGNHGEHGDHGLHLGLVRDHTPTAARDRPAAHHELVRHATRPVVHRAVRPVVRVARSTRTALPHVVRARLADVKQATTNLRHHVDRTLHPVLDPPDTVDRALHPVLDPPDTVDRVLQPARPAPVVNVLGPTRRAHAAAGRHPHPSPAPASSPAAHPLPPSGGVKQPASAAGAAGSAASGTRPHNGPRSVPAPPPPADGNGDTGGGPGLGGLLTATPLPRAAGQSGRALMLTTLQYDDPSYPPGSRPD